MKHFYVVLLLFLATLTTAQSGKGAAFSSGNEFLQNCAVIAKPIHDLGVVELSKLNYCYGYLDGFIQGVLASGGTA